MSPQAWSQFEKILVPKARTWWKSRTEQAGVGPGPSLRAGRVGGAGPRSDLSPAPRPHGNVARGAAFLPVSPSASQGLF